MVPQRNRVEIRDFPDSTGEAKCPHCGEFQDYSQERERVTCDNCGKRFKPSFSILRKGIRGAHGRG
jgi:uncharacterized Zn-finger protein